MVETLLGSAGSQESRWVDGYPVVLNQGCGGAVILCPRHTGNVWRISGCHYAGEVLLASRGWRPGLELNVLQYPGQLLPSPPTPRPMTKNYLVQNVGSTEV